MAMDERDTPNVETDVNGDRFYITEDGDRIQLAEDDDPRTLQKLEEKLKWKQRFPMGMK